MDPIPLRTVRPFLTHEITLDELDDDTTDHLKKDRKNLNTYHKKQARHSQQWSKLTSFRSTSSSHKRRVSGTRRMPTRPSPSSGCCP